MTARTVAFLIIAAGVILLVFVPAHWAGRRSRRHDYHDGWYDGRDAGRDAERALWEDTTGTTRDALAGWNAARPQDAGEWEAWRETGEPPSAEVLFRTADLNQMAAEYEAAQSRAPVVADITSAARWRPPAMQAAPTVEGVVVTGSDRNADDLMDGGGRWHGPNAWERAAKLPDYAAAALGGYRTVDECLDSIVMRAVRP